jgi:hypothetical protein
MNTLKLNGSEIIMEYAKRNKAKEVIPQSATGCVLYAVRGSGGMWFRSKGYSGSGNSWTSEFSKARIYARLGPARAIVSFFATNHPSFGQPEIVSLLIDRMEVVDEGDRIAKLKIRKAKAELKREEQRHKNMLDHAKREYDRCAANLKKYMEKG